MKTSCWWLFLLGVQLGLFIGTAFSMALGSSAQAMLLGLPVCLLAIPITILDNKRRNRRIIMA